MKHVVNLILSQPDHDFVSMRSRRQEKTYMLEARNADEAILRATRKFKELGFYVHGASIVEQKEEAPVLKPLTEGVAEIQAAQEKRKAAMKKATAEVDKSEVQDKAGKAQAGSALATYLKNKAATMKEEVEVTSGYLEEKLTAADPASKWIHDFVHSDNPKFEGKSKKERINMALGAKYAADRALKEDAEQVEEGRAMDYKMSRSSVAGDRGDSKGGEINVSQKDREEIARILGAKDDKKQDKKLEENAEQVEEGVKNNPDLSRKHTSWFVKPAKGKRQFGKEFRMADKDKAEAHAMEIGGSVHKMDQYGSTMKEEVEQIDELSKETLASYIGKAAQSVGTKERVAKGLAVNAAMTTSKKRRDMYLKSAETWRDAAARRVTGIKTAAGKLAKEEVELEEAVSRKDFKQVASIIKEIPDEEKRKELAQHHAEIFANQNPRFDRNRFYSAAGVNLGEEVEQVEEAKADPVAKAKELLDQAEKGTYKGSAKALQAALEKAKSRNFDQGKGYKLEEDAEQLDETGPVKRANKTFKNLMAASKGAQVNRGAGYKMDPADYGYKKAQHMNKAIGRMVSRGAEFVEEGAEGTAPTTPKEKELAAKAGDPNKITKKDVLAARGVKLDEGKMKDIATKRAEDKRLAATQKALDAAKKTRKTVLGDTAHKVNTAPTTGDSSSSLGVGGK